MRRHFTRIFGALALLVSTPISAFPEMVRYGFVSCTTCHLNPNGGGVLTTFGRTAAGALLSTWNGEHESDFVYNTVKLPAWLAAGGDGRAVQTYQDTEAFSRAQFIVMQADVEAAAQLRKWTMDATVGLQPVSGFPILSRRHFVSYRPSPEWMFQAGRFNQAFGINTPDHVIATKRGLGWDEGTETYNFEAVWLKESHDAFLTLNFGRPGDLSVEKGIAVRGRYYATHRARTGVSYFYGIGSKASRHVFGPFVEVGLSPHSYVLFESDLQNNLPPGAASQWGIVDYFKLDHEWIQGFHTYLTQDASQLDFSDPTSLRLAFGIGIQFFPRPHLELNGSWQKRKIASTSDSYEDFAWLMMHFYL